MRTTKEGARASWLGFSGVLRWRSPACGGGAIDERDPGQRGAGRRERRLRRAQHGRQPVGRLRGRRLRGRHDRRDRAGLHGELQGPQGGRLLAGLRHRRGRRRDRGLGPPRPREEVLRRGGRRQRQDFGPTGNVGIIGWYVPPWLAEEHPDILDWENLNKYASDFATSESGGKGQFLGADPSYVQFDEAIVSNLDLDFKVVFSGSEAASITAFQQAEENKEFLIGYFYEPQWLFADLPLAARSPCRRTRRAARTTRPRSPVTTPRPRSRRSSPPRGSRRVARRSTCVKNFNVDQRGPEPRGQVHLRGRHVPRGRRRPVGRGEPRQGRGVARLTTT